MQINSFFSPFIDSFFFVEIVEKLEQSSSWRFFLQQKSTFWHFFSKFGYFLD